MLSISHTAGRLCDWPLSPPNAGLCDKEGKQPKLYSLHRIDVIHVASQANSYVKPSKIRSTHSEFILCFQILTEQFPFNISY